MNPNWNLNQNQFNMMNFNKPINQSLNPNMMMSQNNPNVNNMNLNKMNVNVNLNKPIQNLNMNQNMNNKMLNNINNMNNKQMVSHNMNNNLQNNFGNNNSNIPNNIVQKSHLLPINNNIVQSDKMMNNNMVKNNIMNQRNNIQFNYNQNNSFNNQGNIQNNININLNNNNLRSINNKMNLMNNNISNNNRFNNMNNMQNNMYGNNNNNLSNNMNNLNKINNNLMYNNVNNINKVPNMIQNNMNNMSPQNNATVSPNINNFNNGNMKVNNFKNTPNFNSNNNMQTVNQNNIANMNQSINNNINTNNNLGYQFNNNFSGFKIDFNFINQNNNNNINNEKKIVNQTNDLMHDKETEAFINEIKIIKDKLNTDFNQDELKYITSEQNLLEFFYEKEEEFNNFIDQKFGGEQFLKKYTFDEIKEIFTTNPVINHLSVVIIAKLDDLPLEQMKSEKDFYQHIKKVFNKINVPKFLLKGPLQNLKIILFYSNRISETTTIVNNINKQKSSNSSKLLNLQLEQIKQNENLIFQNINCKYELIYLYIIVNNIELKSKFWHKFLNFLLLNESIIQSYISKNFNHTKIFQEFLSMDDISRNKTLENIFLAIEVIINNDENIIYNIIASFYYLLFYKFKASEKSNEFSNIGNIYLNLTLKNFVIFLDKRYKDKIKFGDNLYELLKELYISDINFLVNKNFYPYRNNLYDFNYIDSVLLKNDKVKKSYELLKEKYEPDGLFTRIQNKLHLGQGRDFSTFEKYIRLIPCDEFVFTNTITIIIDGFTTEESNPMDKWKNFINYFKIESMFYFYKWPSDSAKNIIGNGIKNALRFGSQSFSSASERAKICGKILAYIIFTNEIFKNFQINLIGFSLGNHVIKHCIKELSRLNQIYSNNTDNEINLKNVILVAAATTLKHEDSWVKYTRELIVDKFKNCYSKVDKILQYLYGLCMMKTAIGRDELKIMYENKNLVENYDFTQYNFGHTTYKMETVAKDVSGYYKEL